jgi:hypothetical protein
MAKFKFTPLLLDSDAVTARLGLKSGSPLAAEDKGKFVKLTADSQYGLAAAGDEIEGVLHSHDWPAQADGHILGGVLQHNRGPVPRRLRVTFGEVLDVGDLVVTGTVVASGTALSGPPTVQKADAGDPGIFRWRVVSRDGTTAAGQTGVIEAI